jgi:adenylate cyclase class 2
MKTEIERLFYEINKEELRKKILENGGVLVRPEILMKRQVFSLGLQEDGFYKWARLRDEGDKIKLTFKKTKGEGYAEELETEVTDFEATKNIFIELGIKPTSYQENYREIYTLNEMEISIDTWPFLEPVCELEGESEEKIIEVAKLLNLNFDKSVVHNISMIYKMKYDKWITDLPEDKQSNITFQVNNPFI